MKVDMNLLPEEHRPKPWALPLTIGLIVVIMALGYYGFGYYDKTADANSEIDRLQAQLDSINAEVEEAMGGSSSTVDDYEAFIAEAEAEIESLKAVEYDYEAYNEERVYWKPVLQAIREMTPSDVILTSFEQNENELVIEGELSRDVENAIIIVEFAKLLERRGIFSRPPAFEIDTEVREFGENDSAEIFVFVMLLEVRAGG